MPVTERIIKVLIVDDREDDAKRYSAHLEKIPSSVVGRPLQIEISNNAYFVADKILRSDPQDPPWDIVISDINMPVPDSEKSPGVPQTMVVKKAVELDGYRWNCYFWQPHTVSSTDDWKHGGLHIAQRLAEREGEKAQMKPKLVLISRPRGKYLPQIMELVAQNKTWLDYLNKDSWKDEPLGDEGHLSNESMFVWALLDSLRKLDQPNWGRSSWTPEEDDGFVPTGKLLGAINSGRRLVQLRTQSLLICGETGTGRSIVARVLAREAHGVHGYPSLPPEEVDCSTICGFADKFRERFAACLERTANCALILYGVDFVQPPFQAEILNMIRRRRFRGGETDPEIECRACLVICVTQDRRKLEGLVKEGVFDKRILDFFGEIVVELPSLRERQDDFDVLVQQGLRLAEFAEQIEPSAINYLRERSWEGNVTELFNFLRARSAKVIYGPLKIEHLVDSGGEAQEMAIADDERNGRSTIEEPIESLKITFRLSRTGKHIVELFSNETGESAKRTDVNNREVWLLLLLAGERIDNNGSDPFRESPKDRLKKGKRVFGAKSLDAHGEKGAVERWKRAGNIPKQVIDAGRDSPADSIRSDEIAKKWDPKFSELPLWRKCLNLLRRGMDPVWYRFNVRQIEAHFDPKGDTE